MLMAMFLFSSPYPPIHVLTPNLDLNIHCYYLTFVPARLRSVRLPTSHYQQTLSLV